MAAQIAQSDANDAQRKTQQAQARTAQLQAQLDAQLAELSAKKTERGMVITLGDVLFGTDLSRLTPEGMQTAQKLATVLQQNPQRTVMVEGFADSTGAATYNQQFPNAAPRLCAVRLKAWASPATVSPCVATARHFRSLPTIRHKTAS